MIFAIYQKQQQQQQIRTRKMVLGRRPLLLRFLQFTHQTYAHAHLDTHNDIHINTHGHWQGPIPHTWKWERVQTYKTHATFFPRWLHFLDMPIRWNCSRCFVIAEFLQVSKYELIFIFLQWRPTIYYWCFWKTTNTILFLF